MRDLSASCRMTLLTDLERQGEQEAAISHELPRKPNRSTSFLGGLRELAALLVLIQHYIGYFGQSIHEHGFGERGNYHLASFPFVRILFSGGNAAVAVFFVLSGYVLSKSPLALIRNGKRSACAASLLSAIIRRPIRLYGPPIGTAFVYAMLLHAPWHIVPQVSWCRPKESILAEAVNWLAESIKFFNPFQTHGSSNHVWYSYDIVAWTIPVELKGSILIYGLTAVYAVSNLPLVISLPALATSYFVLLQLGEWTMACFMAGLILAIIDVYSQSERSITDHFTLRLRPIMWTLIFLTGYYLLCQPVHVGEPEYSLNTPGWHFLTRSNTRVL
jgi:peptidoglycan/LPS O-acetylase OafA/YrhL